MSRSIRGEKGPGYDYWSRRPFSSGYGYGPSVKRLCHRAERRQSDAIVQAEIDDMNSEDLHGTMWCCCWQCLQNDYEGLQDFEDWYDSMTSEELDEYWGSIRGELKL